MYREIYVFQIQFPEVIIKLLLQSYPFLLCVLQK